MNTEEKIQELLTRGVEEVIVKEDLEQKLRSGKKLRVKLGIDPTSPNIHLGRSVPLLKLKDFQELGHTIVFIIGDFTGVIGDTSDKESERPMLSREDIAQNLKSYTEQAGKIIDINACEIRYNSEWLQKLTYTEIGEQADIFSLSDFIARENIAKRLKEGKRVSVRELLYPIMQGYDSVVVKASVELGGTDQRFNILAGRDMQKHYGEEPQNVITGTLIEGLDGRKMSSSWGNTINLVDTPEDMFGKIMSLRDDLIIKYFTLVTRVPLTQIEQYRKDLESGVNPKEIKTLLALELVRMYHSEESAQKAKDSWESTFSKGEFPEDAQVVEVVQGSKLIDMLVEKGIVESKSEARRLIEQGAVSYYPDQKINDVNEATREGEYKLKIGKKTFLVLRGV